MPPPLQANYLLQQIITGLGLSDLYRVHSRTAEAPPPPS